MGMLLRQQDSWTYEEVLALIEEQEDRSIRYEFADGKPLVTPAPGGYHQRGILALYDILSRDYGCVAFLASPGPPEPLVMDVRALCHGVRDDDA